VLGKVLLQNTVDFVAAKGASKEGALAVSKVLKRRGDLFNQLSVGDSLGESLGNMLLNLWLTTAKEFREEIRIDLYTT
jgi:hypothetical protein